MRGWQISRGSQFIHTFWRGDGYFSKKFFNHLKNIYFFVNCFFSKMYITMPLPFFFFIFIPFKKVHPHTIFRKFIELYFLVRKYHLEYQFNYFSQIYFFIFYEYFVHILLKKMHRGTLIQLSFYHIGSVQYTPLGW